MSDDLGERERQRERALHRMQGLAAALLGAMLLLFLVARFFQAAHPWLSFVGAFAEAAMVGGVADWFAVTALFRHPMGLPIPHTAIVPRNKERIGQSVGGFVANNFLSPEVVIPKVKAVDVAGKLAGWLARPENARFVARRIAAAGPPLLAAMQDEPVRRMLQHAAMERLRTLQAAPLLARILNILVAGNQHLALFDICLEAAERFLVENQDSIRAKISDKSGWWVPEWIDEKLAKRIIKGALETLDEMHSPDHPWRQQFQEAVTGMVDRLAHDPDTRARAEALKEDVVTHPEVQAYLESLWAEGKKVMMADLAGGDRIRDALTNALGGLGERLAEEPALREVVNGWVNRAILHIVIPNRQRLGNFMAGVVKSWDTRTLVAKLELQVGRDLQYIRINGTLVGGLVGLVIHSLSVAMG